MLFEIFTFEIKYRARRPDTYIYFAILFLFSIVAVDFLFEGNLDPLKRNAPFVIARTMGIVSALFMMIISMIMGVAVLRDFDHQMESFLFINPISKIDYLLGRFLGSFVVLVFIFCGLLFGMVVGDIMPWQDPDSMLPFNFWHYLHPFLYLIVPTLFFGGAIFFVSGALSRKLLVVYTQGFIFLMAYLLAMNLAVNSEDLFLTALLEPFTFQSVRIAAKFWTVAERNALMIPMEGVLLYNRLAWIGVGIIALVMGYFGFSFNVVRDKATKRKIMLVPNISFAHSQPSLNVKIPTYKSHDGFLSSVLQLMHHSFFNFKSIVREVPFWTIVLCGMGMLLISSFNLGTTFGVDSYPTTYIIIGELVELTIIFFLALIVFYSGELIWKERDVRASGIYDALPVSDFINLAGKFIGLTLTYVVLIFAMIIAGVVFQITLGYYHFELDLYFIGFFVQIFPFLFLLTILCFFFQVIINHKFLGHLVVVVFVFATTIALQLLGFDHGLYTFGGSDLGTYSDMNGFGHFVEPYFWFKVYWIAFSMILFIVAVVYSVRGTETDIISRWRLSRWRLTKPLKRFGAFSILIFILVGGYIFYNTNILNKYSTATTQQKTRAAYEKALKHFEYLPQPKIVDVNLSLDLYPHERNYVLEGYFILTNKHSEPIEEIHIQKLPNSQISIPYLEFEGGARPNLKFEEFGYTIYKLDNPMLPGDSIQMNFKQTFTTAGFTERSDTHMVYNGTFLDNFHFPSLGYNEDIELEDDNERKEYGLGPKLRRAKIDDPLAIQIGKSNGDGEEINFEMVVSTDSSQTAIAPGYLQKKWTTGDRTYFHYKMDKPMSNFYSIVSARYEVIKDQWIPAHDSLGAPVSLEIYYHKGHEFNLNRMMNGMKKSLDYFSKHFAPYQYQQLRIVESPLYRNNAQSFPNTIPFSEGIGFIMNINDEEDVDMVFFVTAHEVAHQWWGHQVNPANVQGMSMLSESLAQYSALMVFKDEFPQDKVQKLLKWQLTSYLKGRTREKTQEMPLSLVESGQSYIHYGKGIINFNALKETISEDSINVALKRFIMDWDSFNGAVKTKTEKYPTTQELIDYFREVTPDSLHYIIADLFETIIVYENKVSEAKFETTSTNQYKVLLTLDMQKLKLDSAGVEHQMDVNEWIDVAVYSSEESSKEELIYLQQHRITDQITQMEILVDSKPCKVEVDPLQKFIDRELKDNSVKFQE